MITLGFLFTQTVHPFYKLMDQFNVIFRRSAALWRNIESWSSQVFLVEYQRWLVHSIKGPKKKTKKKIVLIIVGSSICQVRNTISQKPNADIGNNYMRVIIQYCSKKLEQTVHSPFHRTSFKPESVSKHFALTQSNHGLTPSGLLA